MAMEVPLEIVLQGRGPERVICVRGEIDFATAPKLDEAVQQVLDEGATSLVLDFQDVTFLDSEGLKVLLRASRKLKEREGNVRLTRCSRNVKRAFEVLGLESRFDIDCQG
jgi:anti-sigma B factor antagonist